MNTINNNVEHLKPLTSLRFVAAMMIVLLHCKLYFNWEWLAYLPVTLVHGVSFFFVLSGFILSHVYSQRANVTYGTFIWSRFARLWPCHVATILILYYTIPEHSMTFGGEGMFNKWVVLISNLTFTHSLFPYVAYNFSWNSVSWSISTEFFFYLFFPLLLINLKKTWHYKLVLSIAPLVILYFLNILLHIPLIAESIYVATITQIVYTNSFMRLFEFCLGMSSWVAWQNLSKRQLSFSIVSMLEITALILTILWMVTGYDYVVRYAQPALALIPDVFNQWLRTIGSAWIIAILLVSIASAKGLVGRFLSIPIFVWLGEISFAVYMIHQILLKFFVIHYPQRIEAAMYFLVLIIVSAMLHHFIEIPMRKLLLLFGKQIKNLGEVGSFRRDNIVRSPSIERK